MKLSEMSALLRDIGVSPVKSLGQNFLHDRNLSRWIVDQANLAADDYVVEVGPGLGALTALALAHGAHVLAIEKDKRLAQFLREQFPQKNLEIVHDDALAFDTRSLFTQPRVKFLGNLPYYISSQLLIRFLEYPSPICLWVLMLQKELARRIEASPGSSDYGALTLQIQLHYRVEYLRSVSANVFLPKPDVDSALIRITPRGKDELGRCNSTVFRKLVRRGFSQRRKQLGKLIREEASNWEEIAEELGISQRVRGEELSLEQWIALTNLVAPIAENHADNAGEEQFQVVDERDRPKGAAGRSLVHANNLLHRAVHVLIFNPAGEVFLQFRSASKDRHPLKWDSSAAGHVNAGEDYDHAAARELAEELGIDAPLHRMAKLPASEQTGQEFIWIYESTYSGEMQLNASEIEAGRFFRPETVDQWIQARPNEFATGFLGCWKAWREKNA